MLLCSKMYCLFVPCFYFQPQVEYRHYYNMRKSMRCVCHHAVLFYNVKSFGSYCLASLREIVGGNLTYMRFFSSIIFLLLMHNYLIRHLKFFRNALWSLYIIVIILLDTKPTPTLHWKMKKNRYCNKSGIFVWVLAWFYLVNVKLITKSWAVCYLSQHTACS